MKKVQMIATRHYYDKAASKEYRAGTSFEVASEEEADRLVRRKKAMRSERTRNVTDLPDYTPVPATQSPDPDEAIDAPKSEGLARPIYQRRDMQAENGQTGEVEPSQLSRRGRPPRRQT